MRYRQWRVRGEEVFDQGAFEIMPREAVERLLRYELAYGSKIESTSPTSAVFKTEILASTDFVQVTGTPEEMKDVLLLCRLWLKAQGRVKTETIVEELSQKCGGSPFFVNALFGTITGGLWLEELKKELPIAD